MYLCNGPLYKRTTSQAGSVHFLKVVVRVAEVLADHYLANVISKIEEKSRIIVSDLEANILWYSGTPFTRLIALFWPEQNLSQPFSYFNNPLNIATPLTRPDSCSPLVTVLTGFHCTLFQRRSCYVRDVFCREVHDGGNEVVLDDDTSDCPPICSLLSEQQTDGFQGKLDRRGRVSHGTNLHKMLLLDGLYSCEKRQQFASFSLKFKI